MKPIPMWRRYARLLGSDPAADVKDELQFHLQAKVDDLVAQGWREDAARAEAERQFGDVRRLQKMGQEMGEERERGQRRRDHIADLRRDIGYALRTLRMQPGFTITTVLILALGIAANSAVFSVVNTLLLRPLPFPESGRLAWLQSDKAIKTEFRANAGLSEITYTVDAFEQFQHHNQSFESVTAYNPFFGNGELTLTGSGDPQHLLGLMVASNYFQTLGVRPALGRFFEPGECRKGGRPAVLLSHSLWQRQFAADPRIVGQALILNKQAVTVVGVLPPSFDFGSVFSPGLRVDVYIPAVLDEMREWGNTLAVVGRLKPGVSLQQAQAEADILFPQLRKANPRWWSAYESTITGLQDHVNGKLRRSLVVLWCAVGLILLIVCVNLSNLQLARAAARSKEFALRSALGAGRLRLFQQLLTESMVLAAAATVLGLAMAYALTYYLAHQGSFALPLLSSVTVDSAVLGWSLLIGVTTALLFGIVPGLHLASGNLQEALKSSAAGMTAGRGQERMRGIMVISEVALACVLLISAGLLMRSFLNVLDVDLGFSPSQASVVKIDYDDGRELARRGPVLEEILRRVSAIPGVEAAGITDMLPLGRNRSWGLRAKGRSYLRDEDTGILVRIVTPGYLNAMGMRLRSGRDFQWSDSPKSEPVVIINEAAARRHWNGDDPMGRISLVGRKETRVVGLIADVRQHSTEAAAGPEMYLPAMQSYPEGAELVIRSKLPVEALNGVVLQTLRSLNPAQPATALQPLQRIVEQSVSPRRFFLLLVSGFAALGLLLASLGIYGVISYSVTRRTKEIGVRIALGASSAQVLWDVVSSAMRLALAGALIGAAAAFVASKWIATLLFGTRPTDPLTFATIVSLLFVVAMIAGYIPARRASRIAPVTALRTD